MGWAKGKVKLMCQFLNLQFLLLFDMEQSRAVARVEQMGLCFRALKFGVL